MEGRGARWGGIPVVATGRFTATAVVEGSGINSCGDDVGDDDGDDMMNITTSMTTTAILEMMM